MKVEQGIEHFEEDVPHPPVSIDYTNWRGERRQRKIIPRGLYFGSNQWHKTPQYLLLAEDIEDGIIKTFSLSTIHSWK